MNPGDSVMPAIPSSMNTIGAPRIGKQGPVVLRLTTSFSVPGSLPWQFFVQLPTVSTFAPSIFVRRHSSITPSATEAKVGYGIGNGLGAAGVKHTLTANPVIE
ncbi:MAG: hypothetical protein R3B70_20525 [Polyangiaceae bacterium]